MTDRPTAATLEFGEDLALLRWALPPLGASMALAGAGGWFAGQLQPLAASVIVSLGLAAAAWSLRVTTRRITFDASARRIDVYVRTGGRRRSHQQLDFDQVEDVVLRILAGPRSSGDSPLGPGMAFQLILATDAGAFALSRLAEESVQDCEARDRAIWQMLGRTPHAPLLVRSYRHALARRDRLQAIWLARLLEPRASLEDAESRVRREWPSP